MRVHRMTLPAVAIRLLPAVAFVAVLAVAFAWGDGQARAFCGFFVAGSNARLTNNASQVVLLREGTRTSMTMSNTYQGPPENFAMVVPVPVVLQKEDVKTLPANVFEHIDQLSAPRLVEYWEQDPCYVERVYKRAPMGAGMAPSSPARSSAARDEDYGVKVEAQFAVGEYEIVILSAKDSGGLDRWLRDSGYTIPEGAGEALAPYVRDQMKFFVAKVDITKVHRDAQGTVVLSPLRVQYESKEVRLPVRLGLLNAAAKQDLIRVPAAPAIALRGGQLPQRVHFPPTSRSPTRGAGRISPASTPPCSTRPSRR